MIKTLTLVWYFYRPILIVNLFFSGMAIWSISIGGFSTANYMIKLLGYCVCLLFQLKAKTHLFYLNAGYSIKRMYTYAFMLDFICYAVLASLYFSVA